MVNGTDPRNRVWNSPDSASFDDLLAVLLSHGQPGRTVYQLSRDLARLAGDETGLLHMEGGTLLSIKGIGQARATTVMAAAEISRRKGGRYIQKGKSYHQKWIGDYLFEITQGYNFEMFFVFSFNRSYGLLSSHSLNRGGIESVEVYFRDIVKKLLNDRASYAVIAHNHPDGQAAASDEDYNLMHTLETLLDYMGISLLDHLVSGQDGIYSCRTGGLIKKD